MAKQKYWETECDQYVQDSTGKVWKVAGRLGSQFKYHEETPDLADTLVLTDADGAWVYVDARNPNLTWT